MTPPSLELRVPTVGESVTEVEVGDWLHAEGDLVKPDEAVVVLETDKATVEVYAPAAGRLTRRLRAKGERVKVGDLLGQLEPTTAAAGAKPAAVAAPPDASPGSPPPAERPAAPRVMPAAARLMAESGVAPDRVQPTGPGGRVLKEDVQRALHSALAAAAPPATPATPEPAPAAPTPAATPTAESAGAPRTAAATPVGERREEVVPMSLLRRKVAERLVQAQHTAALLTTFNEVDMTAVMALRKEHQERFVERYQVKLGFMSFFVRAVVEALKEVPQLNAEVRDQSIVYRSYQDIGIAIGGGRGLVVPVLRNADRLSFAEIELAIGDFARRAKDGKIRPDDLTGGTFTITNGGVYGSLLSTPIINPPQSGVLGMHAIQDRPVALGGAVVIRPMMYVALTYDHRIVDGREAVTFLKRVKELVENPVRIILEV